MDIKVSRLVIAGLAGDSGKTLVTLSLLAAMKKKAISTSVFKKGPDYIDAAWLSFISGTSCRNLDSYLTDPSEVLNSFMINAKKSEIAIIEGNRGLFDGKDIYGTHSTAQLAKLLKASVVLVVDCTKTTRTIAAIVKGCIDFDTNLTVAGVVLNKIAGKRHQKIITDTIEKFCNIPVLGAIPKLGADADIIPGRHLGLVPPTEFAFSSKLLEKLEIIADKYLDIEKIVSVAENVDDLSSNETTPLPKEKSVKIGYFKDTVFTFYYAENLEALEREGAELIPVSSLTDKTLPDIDALYIGGGFPETFAGQLGENLSLMESVKESAKSGLPIYAECGGLIYLCESINWEDKQYNMAGLFPIRLDMNKKPVGHGYSEMEIDKSNPFYEIGEIIRGHEFHYSAPMELPNDMITAAKMLSGTGLGNKRDCLIYKNCLACYTHIHSGGTKNWAGSLIKAASDYSIIKRGSKPGNFNSPHIKRCKAA